MFFWLKFSGVISAIGWTKFVGRPFLYASTVFSGTLSSSDTKALSRALRTAVRFVYDRGKRDSISSFVVKLLSLPFEKFFAERRLLMLFKMLRFHHSPIYLKLLLDRGTSLRSSLLKNPELSSSWSHRCPIRVSITEWNKLCPSHRHCTDIGKFRRLIHSHLLQWVDWFWGFVWHGWWT